MAISLKGFNKILKIADELANSDIPKMVGEAMGDRAAFEINKYYPDAFITFDYNNGTTKVKATADGLWFREFGTGIVGEGTYSGDLPTKTLKFESRGKKQTTKGWVYEYHPETQKIHGWYWGNYFTRGTVAKAGMYYSARLLKSNQAEIVRQCLRSVGK